MTLNDAFAWLERNVDWEAEPALGVGDLLAILNRARVVDAAGLVVGDTGYTPTWDLNRAAAEAWDAKASKAAGYYQWGAEGISLARQQVYEHCEKRAKHFRRKVGGSVVIGGAVAAVSGYEGEI